MRIRPVLLMAGRRSIPFGSPKAPAPDVQMRCWIFPVVWTESAGNASQNIRRGRDGHWESASAGFDGANIAMTFALRYPEYVKSLILNGGNLSPWGVKLTVQLPVLLGYGLVSLIALFDRKDVSKKEILGLMVHEPKLCPEELKGISAPTLVIAGTKDMIRESHTNLIQKNIPGSRLCIMEGNHFIAAEKSEEFNKQVFEFLGAVWPESVFVSRR